MLAGFSQGGAVSLYTGLRYPERLAGLMALSCYLPLAGTLAAERAPANAGVPIFMAHGLEDGVLPIGMGLESRESLKALGFARGVAPVPHGALGMSAGGGGHPRVPVPRPPLGPGSSVVTITAKNSAASTPTSCPSTQIPNALPVVTLRISLNPMI